MLTVLFFTPVNTQRIS